MANAFSICALVQPWREHIDVAGGQNEAQGNDLTDPKWYGLALKSCPS